MSEQTEKTRNDFRALEPEEKYEYIRGLLHLENYETFDPYCSQEEAGTQSRFIGVVERRSKRTDGGIYYHIYPISCGWLADGEPLRLQRLFSDYPEGSIIEEKKIEQAEQDTQVAAEAYQDSMSIEQSHEGKVRKITVGKHIVSCDYTVYRDRVKVRRLRKLDYTWETLEKALQRPELPKVSEETQEPVETRWIRWIGPDLQGRAKQVRGALKQEDGLDYSERVIQEFLGAMFSNQIIVLSGPPGTGKSSLPPAIARYIGAECRMVSVQSSWTDNQDLLGFYDPTRERFAVTAFLDILVEAREHRDTIYLVCLDEMNLVQVEYYFSEILSAMETRDKLLRLYSPFDYERRKDALEWQIHALEDLIPTLTGLEKFKAEEKLNAATQALEILHRYPAEFPLPENVQFVGTLNMDETTRRLSPKVLDRSFIIKVGQPDSAKPNDEEPSLQNDLSRLEHAHPGQIRAALSARGLAQSKELLRRGLSLDAVFSGKVLPAIRWSGVDLEEMKEFSTLRNYFNELEAYYSSKLQELDYWRR